MKKTTFAVSLLILVMTLLASCIGDKTVKDLIITDGLKTEYELLEAPDFSAVSATVIYDDNTAVTVEFDKLVFGTLDTSTPGSKTLAISYEGFTVYKTVTVKDVEYDPDKLSIVKVSLPESLADFAESRESFINKTNGYVVGDDNAFLFTLKIWAMSIDKVPTLVTSYTSCSEVYHEYSEFPLEGEELLKYVTIDETKHSFDFTEEAIGKTFTITTRPLDISDTQIATATKSFTVTVVDGYNIYEAYELNYITNSSDGVLFDRIYPSETRLQNEIVDDFLRNEKNVTRPENISAIVIHNHLIINPADLPKEYFFEQNRSSWLHDDITIFNHAPTEQNPHFNIHGNYFSVFTYNLPYVIEREGSAKNSISDTILFRLAPFSVYDKNYDHTRFSVTINNIHFADDNSTSSDADKTENALLGLSAFKTCRETTNFNNVRIDAFLCSVVARDDFQTVNITDCKFTNSWHNHLTLVSNNDMQADDEEPIDKSVYPRLTLNIDNSVITKSGGPAIISQTQEPTLKRNKNSGPVVNISENSTVESWVTGTEPWFTYFDVGISMDFVLRNLIYPMDDTLRKYNSTFITEKTIAGEVTSRRYFNIVMVNIMVPDLSNGLGDAFNQLKGGADIDGKLTVGNKDIVNMDDHVYDGKTYNYGNKTLSEVKENSTLTNIIVYTPSGGVAHTGADDTIKIDANGIEASPQNNYVTLLYLSLALVFGDYHSVK